MIAPSSAHPVFPELRPFLLGTLFIAQKQPKESKNQSKSDSIIIWPKEQLISGTEFQEVTLWQTPRVLPITGLTNETHLYNSSFADTDATLITIDDDSTTTMSQTASFNLSTTDVIPSSQQQTALLTTSTAEPGNDQFINFSTLTSAKSRPSTSKTFVRFALLGMMIISLIVMASVVVPDGSYRLQPETVTDVAGQQTAPIATVIEPVATPAPVLPPVDPRLPEGEWLVIPTIGVNAGVTAEADSQAALKKGAWMVPDFGRPEDFSQPTIIASHRYGWLWWWQSDFGRKNSFLLPTRDETWGSGRDHYRAAPISL